jgi:mono/diheme cytochrome c family protein
VGRVLLRRDLAEVRRVPVSIMPSFAEALAPAEAADLLAWIRGVLKTPAGPKPAR